MSQPCRDVADAASFVNNNHHQSPIGKAFHAACQAARVTDKLQEPIYIILELLRAGVVHGNRFGGTSAQPLSGGPSFGSDEEQAYTLLFMRVLSVVPLNFRVCWPSAMNTDTGSLSSGPDRCRVSCWYSTRSSRQRPRLCDSCWRRSTCTSSSLVTPGACAMITWTCVSVRILDLPLLTNPGLPFQSDINTGFGILAKTYLDAAIHYNEADITPETADSEAVQQAKRMALEFVDEAFTGVKNPTNEVERGFRFWDAVS